MGASRAAARARTAYGRGIATDVLLAESFDHSRVTALRHSVASCAERAGLAGEKLGDFVVAVNELLTNAVRHGGGTGRLTLWLAGSAVVCEVADAGTGFAADRVDHDNRPRPDTPGGWGLWLAGELTDHMEITTGTDGTTVRIASGAGADRDEPGG